MNKILFKDKKLNKLWEKAEKGGFTQEELKTLKEEFSHHQDRIDEYYSLLETLNQNDKSKLMQCCRFCYFCRQWRYFVVFFTRRP